MRKDPKGTVVGGGFEDSFDPETLHAAVDAPRRHDIERNHSATHLVHYALRKHLGPHVRQQGSLVQPDRLRFDFSHHGPIDAETLHRIEQEVNDLVLGNPAVDHPRDGRIPTHSRSAPWRSSRRSTATWFAWCRWVHPSSSAAAPTCAARGQIGSFRFSGQTGVAAGVRRIEAVTGSGALRAVRELEQRLAQVADALKSQPEHLVRRVEQLLEERQRLEARLAEALKSGGGAAIEGSEAEVNGVKVTIADTATDDRDEVGQIADSFREGKRNAVLVLFSTGGRGAIHVTLTDDLVSAGRKAGDLVNRIAALSGGKGGGRPHFASAGAGDPVEAFRGARRDAGARLGVAR